LTQVRVTYTRSYSVTFTLFVKRLFSVLSTNLEHIQCCKLGKFLAVRASLVAGTDQTRRESGVGG